MEDQEFLEDGVTPNPKYVKPEGQDKDKGGDDKSKTLTQEEVNKIVSERVAREKEKLEKGFQKTLEEEKKESERMAKLTADQREKEITEKQKNEIATREKELTLRENKLEGINKLNELNIPIKFVDFVLSEDKEKMEENIKIFEESWKKAVSEEVDNRLKGKSSKDVNGNPSGKTGEISLSF